MTIDLFASLRREARDAPQSGIVEVMNHGRNKPGIIPLWAGEGDEPTPAYICDAVTQSLAAGETFYTWQRGIPDLRAAIARYHERQFGGTFAPERFFVTVSGMQAIQISFAAVLGAGDECLMPSPAWPNAAAALGIAGAKAVFVPMSLEETGWKLDIGQLFAAKTSRTRAIFLNSPSNPTGWTATREEMQAILDFARREGVWIIADEIYNRFHFAGGRAPSFHDIIAPDDRVIFVNTFSKNWSMTGWRLGWIEASPVIGQVIENLIQYSTSGVPVFVQRGGVAALEQGEDYARHLVERAREGREIVCSVLGASNRVRFSWPAGAFYLFFAIEGEPDVRQLGLRLVDEANIGIAPGTAFGPGGEGYMRLCFLRNPDHLREAMSRLSRWLQQ